MPRPVGTGRVSPRTPSKKQSAEFTKYQPHVYIHTSTIEAVLAPIAEQLSNLIVITSNAEKKKKGIPNLTEPAREIVAAGDNLINIGIDAMEKGDDELRRTMPTACRSLKEAAKTFQRGTSGLLHDPFSAADRDLLVKGVRGLLAGTTDILISYDSYDVRKMVNLCTSMLQRLSFVSQLHSQTSMDSVEDTLALLENDAEILKPMTQERAEELRNDTHRRRLIAANGRLEYTLPLLVSSARTAVRHFDSSEAQDNVSYASKELHSAVSDIIAVLTATDVDDQSFKSAAGDLATWLNNAREELFGRVEDVEIDAVEAQVMRAVSKSTRAVDAINRNSAIDFVLDDLDLCIDAAKSKEASAEMQQVRNRLNNGEAQDGEAEVLLREHKELDPELRRSGMSPEPPDTAQRAREVAEICAGIETMLGELKDNPSDSRIEEFQDKLAELDTAVRTAAVDEMTTATLVNEYPADHLIEVSKDLSKDLDSEIASFRAVTVRMVDAADMVAGTSTDSGRCLLLRQTAQHLQIVSSQLVNAVKMARDNPEDQDVLNQRELLRSNYNGDLDVIKETVSEMVDAQILLDADYAFVKSMADTAMKAANSGYAGAARAAVRKLRKRIGHVITVASVEMDNTTDENYKAKLDEALLSVEDIDPQIDAAMKSLTGDSLDAAVIAKFETTLTEAVAAVHTLKMCALTQGAPIVRQQRPAAAKNPEDIAIDPSASSEIAIDIVEEQLTPAKVDIRAMPVHGVTVKVAQNLHESVLLGTPIKEELNDSMEVFERSAEVRDMPVMKAAVKLRKETNKWSTVGNPIVAAAKAMAGSMAHMAHISGQATGDMGDMITTAKSIIDHANSLIKWARGLAARCSDKRLKADILNGCERIQTFGVQLKIVASVKATSTPEDASESDAMLVNTAQHLMDEAQHLVRSCESASLKLLPANPEDLQKDEIAWNRRTDRRSVKGTWRESSYQPE